MGNGKVEVRAIHRGYVPRGDLEDLARALAERGFDSRALPPSDTRGQASSPWDVIEVILDEASAPAITVVLREVVEWARARRKRNKAQYGDRDHWVTIYGPDGEPLKEVEIRGKRVKKVPRTDRAMMRGVRRDRRRKRRFFRWLRG